MPRAQLLRALFAAMLALLLAGCGKPLPADRVQYVGEWQGPEMYLLITREGTVKYKRGQSATTASFSVPLKTFHGDSFEVGVGPMTTVFNVSQPPQEVFGKWKMTVDGVELTRTDDLSSRK